MEVKNTGGVGTNYNYTLTLQDLKGNMVLNASGSDSIHHSETKTISFTVPDTGLATEDYKLFVKVTDAGTGKKTSCENYVTSYVTSYVGQEKNEGTESIKMVNQPDGRWGLTTPGGRNMLKTQPRGHRETG